MSQTLKAIFDTQIYLRALINLRSACGKLVFERQSDYQLLTCAEITQEVMDVLTRSSIRQKFPQISDADVSQIGATLQEATLVEVKSEDIERICRDPKDDIFLACAKAASADYLVSEDKDLLVIGQHHTTGIINVATFLTALEQQRTSSTPENE